MTIPIDPPAEWFQPPAEGIPTDKRITVDESGRVYGYIALWNTCHVGHQGCVKPPKGSPSKYEYAHQGETLTAEGSLIKTAVIAGGKGHAPVDMATANVPEYYENMGAQLMRVRYGEDENGLWFAGALWPDVEDLQVAQIRASSISGDWRFHAAWRRAGGGYDFAGACLVNIPGFPMSTEGDLTQHSGQPYALAASAFVLIEEEETNCMCNNEELTASAETEQSCDGNCSECTCGKIEEIDEETAQDILQAAYQLIGKKMKKKPHTIKADADTEQVDTEELEVPTQEDLSQTVASIKEAVDWLVAERLTEEISKES